MAINPIKMKRDELYELVWSTPLLQLAKRYGLSDRGLAKICKRMEIPLPGLGYWAKVAAGHAMEKAPLEPLSGSGIAEYEFIPVDALPSAPQLSVDQSLKNARLHPLVAQTRSALERLTIGPSTEFLINRDQPHLDIRVRPEALERGLCIMNAVVLALEANGHVFTVERSHDGFKTLVSVDQDQIAIRLAERILRHQSLDAKGKGLSPTFSSTGELEISFDRKNGVRKSWKDKKKQPIEQVLGEFVGSIKAIAEENKESRINREAYEERRRQQEQEKAARDKINAEKRDFLRGLETQAAYWRRAKAIRNYRNEESRRVCRLDKCGSGSGGRNGPYHCKLVGLAARFRKKGTGTGKS
jgi:hypothetical protein